MNHQPNRIIVSIDKQELYFYQADKLSKTYLIASAKNGTGQVVNSECTPLGKHQIYEKIGSQAALNSVFVARQLTGEIYSDELAEQHPNRDWILTRILWLEGLESGFNRGSLDPDSFDKLKLNTEPLSCDTRQRFIYIHGCPDSHPMQVPSSHGCIKMRNTDIIELYEWVSIGTQVTIQQ